jgi:NitT/TauT family transport system substrate-binding protein
VEFVSGAYEHTMLSQVRCIDMEVIAMQNDSFGVVIGLPPAKAAAYNSPKDLKGMKFGVTSPGSSSAVAVDLLMTQAGLSQNDVSTIAVGAGAGAVAAMESGQIDAISNYDPAISILVQDNKIKPIIDTRTDEGLKDLYGGRFAGSAFYVRSDFAKSHPNTVQAFANAIADTLNWMHGASTEEIVAAVPESYFGGDKALYAKTLDAYRGMFSKTGRIERDVAERVLKIQKQVNADVAKADVDLSRTYDNSFIDRAMKR